MRRRNHQVANVLITGRLANKPRPERITGQDGPEEVCTLRITVQGIGFERCPAELEIATNGLQADVDAHALRKGDHVTFAARLVFQDWIDPETLL